MQRVQAALKDQLTRQKEKLEIDLRKQQETVKSVQEERERLGVQLYGVQQQLARQQVLLEREQDDVNSSRGLREQKEGILNHLKDLYRQMLDTLKTERQQTVELRQEVEEVTGRLRFLTEAHQTVQGDIALTRRATEKTTSDVAKAEEDKLNQDLYLDRLTSQIASLDEQIALYDAQHSAQCHETKAVKENLTEASLELEALLLEKKKLLQQWNSTLIGMRRRDEAYAAILAAVSVQKQQIRSLETEIENYRKSTTQEQERNEQLTLMLNKLRADIGHVERQLALSHGRHEELKTEYTTFTRTLQETEQALARANTDCSLKRNELGTVRTQTEREAREKRKLEDVVMEKMMQQLTMDKSTQYTRRSVEGLQAHKEKLETAAVEVENDIAKTLLQVASLSAEMKRLQSSLDRQQEAMDKQNKFISQSETEIGHNNALIERKQTQIDQLNKKISQRVAKLDGGEDLGPLELKIDTLQKQISDSVERCAGLQNFWLRQQNELVRKTRGAEDEARAVDCLRKQQLILQQKKMRIDGQLEREEKERVSVEQSISRLQHEMRRLCTLISEKSGEQTRLEQDNLLMQNDFVHALKESELECIQTQTKVEQLKEEKERLLNSLVEAERQIMLWERKITLAKEMREMVDSETGQADIRAMQAEIHRMEVRYNQLMRQQEKMIQDMEKAVYRREAIQFKSEVQVMAGKSEGTQGHMKKKITDLQRQIKQTGRDTAKYEKESVAMSEDAVVVERDLERQQGMCQSLQSQLNQLETETTQSLVNKTQGMAELYSEQAKYKQLVAAKDGRYRLMAKSKEGREVEEERQLQKLRSLQAVVDKIRTDFPATQEYLQTVSVSLSARLSRQQRVEEVETA
ncbi:Coiled-coil domain-containing protein 40 [Geodia barretti]|nr:Coiled-coil domain-containing protein 40 [Geodia barretti]